MRSTIPLLFELSKVGRRAADLPPLDVPVLDALLPEEFLGETLPLPELSEVELIRHYIRLSRRNFGVDNGSYPLGSCTMKYNPKINEEVAGVFRDLHPLLDEEDLKGAFAMMAQLQKALCEVTGMDAFTHGSACAGFRARHQPGFCGACGLQDGGDPLQRRRRRGR